jgi:hypothetical protein
LDDTTDFVVGIGHIRGEDIRLADEQFLFIGIKRIPFGRLSGQGVSWVFAGITPNFFWLAKIVSRRSFQPLSNRCRSLIFLIHSGVVVMGCRRGRNRGRTASPARRHSTPSGN